jgi:hypothetical protein
MYEALEKTHLFLTSRELSDNTYTTHYVCASATDFETRQDFFFKSNNPNVYKKIIRELISYSLQHHFSHTDDHLFTNNVYAHEQRAAS